MKVLYALLFLSLFFPSLCRVYPISKLRFDRKLGSGGQGSIYAGIDRTLIGQRNVAVKLCISIDPIKKNNVANAKKLLRNDSGTIKKEYEIIQAAHASHVTGVVILYGVLLIRKNSFLYIKNEELLDTDRVIGYAMEKCSCTLKTFLTQNTVDMRFRLESMISLSRTLSELHEAGITHEDLKLENVVICPSPHSLRSNESNRIKLIDFGFSTLLFRRENEISRGELLDMKDFGMLFLMTMMRNGEDVVIEAIKTVVYRERERILRELYAKKSSLWRPVKEFRRGSEKEMFVTAPLQGVEIRNRCLVVDDSDRVRIPVFHLVANIVHSTSLHQGILSMRMIERSLDSFLAYEGLERQPVGDLQVKTVLYSARVRPDDVVVKERIVSGLPISSHPEGDISRQRVFLRIEFSSYRFYMYSGVEEVSVLDLNLIPCAFIQNCIRKRMSFRVVDSFCIQVDVLATYEATYLRQHEICTTRRQRDVLYDLVHRIQRRGSF